MMDIRVAISYSEKEKAASMALMSTIQPNTVHLSFFKQLGALFMLKSIWKRKDID